MRPEPDSASVLKLLFPHIHEPLRPLGAFEQQLLYVAAHLPAVSQTLLECRLHAPGQAVDLSQHFARADRDRLLAFLSGLNPADTTWEPIARLARAWQHDEGPLPAFSDLWLEYDCDGSSEGELITPAVFVKLNKQVQSFRNSQPLFKKLLQVLVGEQLGQACLQSLEQLVLSRKTPQAPAYIGAMLNRPGKGIRAHFQITQADKTMRWLQANRWPGGLLSLENCLALLEPLQGHCMLCLELQPGLSPRIGIEIYRDGSTPWEKELLELCVQQGWCSASAAEAVGAWPGNTTPANVACPWPEQWIAQSLVREESSLDLIERRVNHLKLVCDGDQPIAAKAYLSATHRWVEAEPNPATEIGERA